MTTTHMRNKKLKIQLGFEPNTGRRRTASTPTNSRPVTPTTQNPRLVERSVYDITFEEYKAANLDIRQQHELIEQIRNEVPLIDRDEIDGFLLAEAAKQLEMSIFPMFKMMHVDPKAVKRMLDEQFRRAYGPEVAEAVAQDMTSPMAREIDSDAGVGVEGSPIAASSVRKNSSGKAKATKAGTEAAPIKKPAKKKAKRAPLSATQKVINAHQAKRKREKKPCCVATFHSKAAAGKWAELTGET